MADRPTWEGLGARGSQRLAAVDKRSDGCVKLRWAERTIDDTLCLGRDIFPFAVGDDLDVTTDGSQVLRITRRNAARAVDSELTVGWLVGPAELGPAANGDTLIAGLNIALQADTSCPFVVADEACAQTARAARLEVASKSDEPTILHVGELVQFARPDRDIALFSPFAQDRVLMDDECSLGSFRPRYDAAIVAVVRWHR
jgi:hypothetical protein